MEKADERPDVPLYELLVSCPHGLSRKQVSVVFDSSFDRIPHPDNNLESTISEIWNQRLEKNASLFNGTKFRYGDHVLHYESNSTRCSHVCLHMGLTDYRTFVGTNLNPLWEKFLVPSEDDLKRCGHLSSPMGNGAVVETSDNKILVWQRSNNVGEFPGHFVFPGGHPEPLDIGIVSHPMDKCVDSKLINAKIAEEMFDSIVREVVEEIGVPSTSLSDQVFIGTSRRILNVRPAAFFFLRCSLPSNEIQQLYKKAQDGYESTQLFSVEKVNGLRSCMLSHKPSVEGRIGSFYPYIISRKSAFHTIRATTRSLIHAMLCCRLLSNVSLG